MLNIGQIGYRWFIGVVEDILDPEKAGRVRVRIQSVHTDNTTHVPTQQLPWATLVMPVTSPSFKGVGISPTGIDVGSTVIGFFLDGNECNFPVILGTIYGTDRPEETVGIDRTFRSEDRIGTEPAAAAIKSDKIYPNNKVIRTKSGHVIEIDDTPDYERINIHHRSGTYIEIDSDGRLVIKSAGDYYDITAKNKVEYIQGNYTLKVQGDIKINGKSINLNDGVKGAARKNDSADTGDGPIDGSNNIESGSTTVFIGG